MDNLFLLLMLISIGILVYSIRKKSKKHIIFSVIGILVFFVAFGMTTDTTTTEKKEKITTNSTKKIETKLSSEKKIESNSSSKEKEIKKVAKKENKKIKKDDKPKEKVKKEIANKKKSEEKKDKVNSRKETVSTYQKDLDEYLEMNKGWADGTIDADGNPTESGVPNQDYYLWNYVTKIKIIDDKEIEVQATEDLKTMSNSDKDTLASSIQGYIMSVTGAESADDRLPIYFYNGENALGNSKILEKNKYSWVK